MTKLTVVFATLRKRLKLGPYLRENIDLSYKNKLVKAYRELMVVYCEKHIKHLNISCGKGWFLNVTAGATYN